MKSQRDIARALALQKSISSWMGCLLFFCLFVAAGLGVASLGVCMCTKWRVVTLTALPWFVMDISCLFRYGHNKRERKRERKRGR